MTKTLVNQRMLDLIVLASKAEDAKSTRGRSWTKEEDQFIRDNQRWMSDEEMGRHLGRTAVAVKIRWEKDLHLPFRSKHPDVIIANQAAKMLGIDGHKIVHWVDVGIIPGGIMPGGQRIRVINRTAFMVWACSPKNWVYFDVKKVRDPHLKRLLKLKATRWGDEWWRPRQMAAYHGMEETKLIHQNIKFGLLESFRIPVSYSGVARDDRLCSPRFILKSVAIRHKFLKRGEFHKTKFTLAADAWLLKAHDELGMTFVEIARTMKLASSNVIRKRYLYLKQGKGK